MLLYWNPSLVTNRNGESTIKISTTSENHDDIRINYSTGNK